MKIFGWLYEKVIAWSKHPKASTYLGVLSFAESSFFPIPPDVMLAPMSVAQPSKAWRFAFITTITSVLGGVFGYFIGAFAFEFIQPWVQSSFGRGARFFLVAGLLKYAGPKLEPVMLKYVEWIGWITVLLLIAVIAYFKFLH